MINAIELVNSEGNGFRLGHLRTNDPTSFFISRVNGEYAGEGFGTSMDDFVAAIDKWFTEIM